MADTVQLIYVHDPMCSWCWGFRPTLQAVFAALPEKISLETLLGGLAPDTDRPMPEEMQRRIQQTWRQIQENIPGTQFNFDFWRHCSPRRSTYPACRAVLAARILDLHKDAAMTYAIQQAYYLRAMNPSDTDTLIQVAGEIGLPEDAFAELLVSETIQQQLQTEIRQARKFGADSFPSLLLQTDEGFCSIGVHYTNPQTILQQIADAL